jgi:hypothetical protein
MLFFAIYIALYMVTLLDYCIMREGSVDLWTLFIDDAFSQSVTADTNILSDFIMLNDETRGKRFRTVASYTFEGAFSSAGILSFIVKRLSDNSEVVMKVNGGSTLLASSGFTFNITLTEGYALNLRYSSTCTLNYLTITGHGGKI